MRNLAFWTLLSVINTLSVANVTLDVYESDGVTLFDNRNITVGTQLKLIVSSDSNDLWGGGLFLDAANQSLGCLTGSGYDPNTRDWTNCHYTNAGSEPYVYAWEDSLIKGFDLFTSAENDAEPGAWFVVDYTALEPGDPNVGFYDYHASWDDPNAFVFLHQVPAADFNADGIVNFLDYSLLASCWLQTDCTDPDGCLRADLDGDAAVDANDLFRFADFWLWGADEDPNQGETGQDPGPDPNLIYRIVDVNGLDDITMAVGESITLYVDMDSADSNSGMWAFTIEVDLSDPTLGSIDNTAYDPNNPPGDGTARILADPNRWTMFDRWGPGFYQAEGIYLSGVSMSAGFGDGHLASFVYTSTGTGDVVLNLNCLDSINTSGEKLYPTLKDVVIHQYDPAGAESMMMSSLSMDTMSTDTISTPESAVPTVTEEEMLQFLGDVWETDPDVQNMIDQKDWKEFIENVEQSYQ